jgi:hypothetical protein
MTPHPFPATPSPQLSHAATTGALAVVVPAVAAVVVAAAVTLFTAGCAGSAAGSPGGSAAPPSPLASPAASVPPVAPGTYVPSVSPAAPASGVTSRALTAAATARRLCSLITRHRYGAAQRLLTAPHVWPRSELRAIRSLRFRTARVWGTPAADAVKLLVTVRAAVTWRSPLSNGRNDIYLSFARRGTTGDWLVSAVHTSP